MPSDSSSGISDDASSSGSGSDRDSGIETGDTGQLWVSRSTGCSTVPVSYGIDHDDRSLDNEDREKIRETLEIGVRKLNLVGKQKSDSAVRKNQGREISSNTA